MTVVRFLGASYARPRCGDYMTSGSIKASISCHAPYSARKLSGRTTSQSPKTAIFEVAVRLAGMRPLAPKNGGKART